MNNGVSTGHLSRSYPCSRSWSRFRIANEFGLFAVMTRDRYEIEFQGSRDGRTWTPYPFRYKPQDVRAPPGIYAPYQPRFDWNLWFASLGTWRQYPFVVQVEERLLSGEPDVLALFSGNPFPAHGLPSEDSRGHLCNIVVFRLGMTKRTQGSLVAPRAMIGLYAPTLERTPDGNIYRAGQCRTPPNLCPDKIFQEYPEPDYRVMKAEGQCIPCPYKFDPP